MNRKNKINAVIAIIIKRRQSFKAKLLLLLAQWRKNTQIIIDMACGYSSQVQRIVSVEETSRVTRRMWKFDRKGTFWESDVPKMDQEMFKDNYRVSRTSFEKICGKTEVMTRQDTMMRPCIPLNKRVAIALYALGSSSEYRTVAHLFGVGRSTVGEIVLEFCKTVCNTLSSYISSYPPTPGEIRRIVDGFKNLGFPQCYGALDGCHIEIQPKKEEAVDYYNYKGWYSTVLLAACDHRSKFTYINIGSAGRNNDSYIFERSGLKRFHETTEIFEQYSEFLGNVNIPVLLIGDSAFRLSKYLMKPYPFKIDQPEVERNFNYNLSKCRRVIENAFGQLKARFRKIGRGLEVDPENYTHIIKACCLLHNFFKEEEDEVNNSWIVEEKAAKQRVQPVFIRRVDKDESGKAIRDAIACALYNPQNTEDEMLET